jgi:hypothetical protein
MLFFVASGAIMAVDGGGMPMAKRLAWTRLWGSCFSEGDLAGRPFGGSVLHRPGILRDGICATTVTLPAVGSGVKE